MFSLVFINIKQTKIFEINLKCCNFLKMVIADANQLALANEGVNILEFTLPAKAAYRILDTQ